MSQEVPGGCLLMALLSWFEDGGKGRMGGQTLRERVGSQVSVGMFDWALL